MKKPIAYRKMRIAYFINILQWVVFIVIIPCLCMTYVEKKAAIMPDILISVVFACFNCYFISLYINHLAFEKCEIYAYQLYLNKAVRISTRLRITLLALYAELGWKDRVWDEMQSLNAMSDKLSDVQKIQVECTYIDYLNSKMAKQYLSQLSDRIKQIKVTFRNVRVIRRLENKIHFHEYMLKEEWGKALEVLQELSCNSVYEQVVRAYGTGICYLNLGKKEEAASEFLFAYKYGGSTKYVLWAKNILAQLKVQEKETQCKRPFTKKRKGILTCIIISVVLIGFSVFISNYHLYGETVEEAYRLKYNIGNNQEVLVLYERNVGNQKMAILYHKGEVIYCVLNQDKDGKKYKIQDAHRDDINSMAYFLENTGGQLTSQEDKEVLEKNFTKREVDLLFKCFYRKKGWFEEKPNFCAGIFCDPVIEGLVIDGVPADVKQIQYQDMTFYLWVVDGIDYETVEERDISIVD